MKSKILFSFLFLFSLNAFADFGQFAGQDGNGSDGGLTDAERRACNMMKYALRDKDAEDFTLTILHEDELLTYTRDDLLRKCCHVNKNNCN